MTTTRNTRVAKSGKSRGVLLDDASLVRAAFCERVAQEHLNTEASVSTIIRRALYLYMAHCESLLKGEIGDPEDAELYERMEATQLRAANKGSSYRISADYVREAPVLRTIKEMEQEFAPSKQPLINSLKRDLERWNKTNERQQPEHTS